VVNVHALVAAVPDPELPFLTIEDLGILRSVSVSGTAVRVAITPTYSGCPATEAIRDDILAVLSAHGMTAEVVSELSPAWTTDWITDRGRQVMAEHGIAPPGDGPVLVPLGRRSDAGRLLPGREVTPHLTRVLSDRGQLTSIEYTPEQNTTRSPAVVCPQCGSRDTQELSRFGATACKSLWRCEACREPFERFKQH
jgi:ring-1,2-phenylacetyl-CoA epoxidase subunit PaaD